MQVPGTSCLVRSAEHAQQQAFQTARQAPPGPVPAVQVLRSQVQHVHLLVYQYCW